jgi:steroid 5-alpha reductase family enzyme
MVPWWVVLVGPVSVTVALFVASIPTHKIIVRLILKRELYGESDARKEKEKQTCDEEIVANLYVAMFSLIVALTILVVISWIYSAFTQGVAKWVAWIVAAVAVFIFFSLFILSDSTKWVNPDDFKKGRGHKITGFFWAQPKSRLNWIRISVLFLSYALAGVVYLYGGF